MSPESELESPERSSNIEVTELSHEDSNAGAEPKKEQCASAIRLPNKNVIFGQVLK